MKYSEHKNVFIYIVLLLGVFYLAYLLSLPEDAIFYSGDGGLKYLMSRQFSNGDISPALILPVTTTANKLWNKGLYPFDAPFVYEIDKRKIVSFPLYFPLISAPFLALLGWRGLYVLPAAAVFLIWIWILHRFRAAKFSITTICIVLFSIVFSSPLTLYGAMYWEHAPAACLGCIPIFLFLRKQGSKQTALKSIVLGALSGLAVFLRPEVLVCVSISICACLVCLEKQRIKQIHFFSVGFILSIATFFMTNQLIYGDMLGVHSLQILQKECFSYSYLQEGFCRALHLFFLFCQYWPLLIFVIAILPIALLGSSPYKKELIITFLVVIISIPLIALIVPNDGGKQWGSRYLLVLIPWGAIMVGLIVETLLHCTPRVKVPTFLLLVICLTLGFITNTLHGTRDLTKNYRFTILPASRLIEKQPQQFVIISHQWIAQELAVLMDKKTFLWARNSNDIHRIKTDPLLQDVNSILFITYKGISIPEEYRFLPVLGETENFIIRMIEK